MDDRVVYLFQCPECGESTTVNEPMREAMLERGCLICGCNLTESAFETPPAGQSGDQC